MMGIGTLVGAKPREGMRRTAMQAIGIVTLLVGVAGALLADSFVFGGIVALGALLNFASQSRWENYLWGPVALTLAILCTVVARSAVRTDGFAGDGGMGGGSG